MNFLGMRLRKIQVADRAEPMLIQWIIYFREWCKEWWEVAVVHEFIGQVMGQQHLLFKVLERHNSIKDQRVEI